MTLERTQVAIIGAGPAGLTLSHILHRHGIESIVLERRDRAYVERRLRAGVLEHGTVNLFRSLGLAERLDREALVHHGINLQFEGERHRIPVADLTGGRAIAIYGQHEVVKDLIAIRLTAGCPIVFEAEDASVHDVSSPRPRVRYQHGGEEYEIECDFVAACDGSHGVCRSTIPVNELTTFERTPALASKRSSKRGWTPSRRKAPAFHLA